MMGILLDSPLVGIFRAGEVPGIEVHVSKAEVNRRFFLAVAEGIDKEVNCLFVSLFAAQGLRPLQNPPHELFPLRGGQLAGVGERRDKILAFTALMSCHVKYFGLPFSELGLRKR